MISDLHTLPSGKEGAFTLIELSIVLVIIGLIVGGVLAGRDLISAAGVRAQISQIEKYQQAVNTFRGKYGSLPGDIPEPDASRFGFLARGIYKGQGDGDGILDGNILGGIGSCMSLGSVPCQAYGENIVFFRDLSTAKLIDGSFTSASFTNVNFSGSAVGLYLPKAKLNNAYVYVWSGGWQATLPSGHDGNNYFGIAAVTGVTGIGNFSHFPALTVSQAHAIDKKTDDGLPQFGHVLALSPTTGFPGAWASGGTAYDLSGSPHVDNNGDGDSVGGPVTAESGVATPAGDYTCFDNGNISNTVEKYSITHQSGNGMNCVLSLKFQ